MNKIAIFLADGFEEIEGLTVVDIVRRAGIQIDTISINGRLEVNGSHGIQVKADKILADINKEDYSMLVLPGGKVGTENLESCEELLDMIGNFYGAGKYIAAICAAPSIFAHRGYLSGRKATSHPAFESHLQEGGATVTHSPVEIDSGIITGQGMSASIEFALTIVEICAGREEAVKIAKAIVHHTPAFE
ncbi:MAG: DJ-1/PfpI family protein [Lachnospiraceae bacterium]|nr:DJ-1/PfpI family protein [Lachnospiraceae bacterium]